MKVGDLVLFYHSNCKPPHVAGVAKVIKQGYPDFTAHDPNSNYFDPKSSDEKPRWSMVDIEPVALFKEQVPLHDLRENPALEGMPLLRKGQRLSIQPVDEAHFLEVCRMSGTEVSP